MNTRRTGRFTARRATLLSLAAAAMLAAGILAIGSPGGTASRSQQPGTPAAGTPVAGGLPIVPAAAECVVAPVAFADLPAVQPVDPTAATPAPAILTGGTPATPEQSVAALATIQIQIACVNAGDIPRALALTGGAYRDRLFARTGTPTEAEYAVLATPLPRVDGTVIVITAIDGVMSFPDGTLTVQVTTLTTATTVNMVTLAPSATSPTGYVIVDQRQVSRIVPTRTPIA